MQHLYNIHFVEKNGAVSPSGKKVYGGAAVMTTAKKTKSKYLMSDIENLIAKGKAVVDSLDLDRIKLPQ